MLLDEIARTSAAVAQTPARLKKIDLLAETLRHARPDEIPTAVAYLSGVLPQGTIGVGWASLRGRPAPALPPPTLKLLDVDAAFEAIKTATGPGSQTARRTALAALFEQATATEQRFLTSSCSANSTKALRKRSMLEAVAKAAGVPTKEVRRALMLAGDLGAVAKAVIAEGQNGLVRFRLQILRPIQPTLARPPATSTTPSTGSAQPPWSGSWTGPGSRCTGWATRCGPSPAAWLTSPSGSRRWSRRHGHSPSMPWS